MVENGGGSGCGGDADSRGSRRVWGSQCKLWSELRRKRRDREEEALFGARLHCGVVNGSPLFALGPHH